MVNSHRRKGIALTAAELFFLFSETNQKHQTSNTDFITYWPQLTDFPSIYNLLTHKLGISG